MRGSLLGIILLIVLLVVGLAVGVWASGERVQRRAAVASFAVLAVLDIAFFVLVVGQGNMGIVPVVAIGCLVIPAIVYSSIMAISGKRQKAAASVSKQVNVSKQYGVREETPVEVVEVDAAREAQHVKPEPMVEVMAAAEAESVVAVAAEEESVVAVAAEAGPVVAVEVAHEPMVAAETELKLEPEPEASPEPGPASEPVFAAEPKPAPELLPEPEPEPISESEWLLEAESKPELIPESVFESEPIVEPELESISELESESELESAPEAEQAPVPVPEPEPAPEPAPALVPEPELAPTSFNPDSYFKRATVLRDAGQFLIATKLYAECASLTSDTDVRRKALVQEIACYVKGGDLRTAQEHALRLQQDGSVTLSPSDKIKLAAVLGVEC